MKLKSLLLSFIISLVIFVSAGKIIAQDDKPVQTKNSLSTIHQKKVDISYILY